MSNPNVEPLSQQFSIAAQVPDHRRYFFHDPNLARMPDGTLFIAAPQWPRRREDSGYELRMMRSIDGGERWQELSSLPYQEGIPFELDGRLLMFVQEKSHSHLQIVTSADYGVSWTDPITLIEGPLWNISTARVLGNEKIFWAVDYDLPGMSHGGKTMLTQDRHRSVLDPDSWKISNVVEPPEVPEVLTRNLYPSEDNTLMTHHWSNAFVWLEPNTVNVGGCIRVFTRVIIDEYASAHMAAVLDYNVQENHLEFTQLAAWPGGQCKFFVVPDQECRRYWMLSNLVTNSQDLLNWGVRMQDAGYHGGPGNERRWLFLHYSIDCLNWFPAGCIARWSESVLRSFMYPSAVIDGEDMIVLSRSTRDSGDQHDADLCTIHRVVNFRDLAMDLHQGGFH